MELKEPYTIAYRTYTSAANIFLRIETDKGITGYGCCAPEPEITGETCESVLRSFSGFIEPRLQGADPSAWQRILEEMRRPLVKQPAALMLADTALYDILGKTAGQPVFKLLGGYRQRIITSMTIGIMPVEDTVAKARSLVKQGFKALKIKGGSHVEDDIEKILRVREAVGPGTEIRFDANQGYQVEESLRFARETIPAKIAFIEQPTDRAQPGLMLEVTGESPASIMADESLMGVHEAFRLAKSNLVDMLNIKLVKCGGITEALHIAAIARISRMPVMVGCMDEAALGIAAGLHFALARPEVKYADLDGHLDLLNDPSTGTVILKDGYLYTNQEPGLGFIH